MADKLISFGAVAERLGVAQNTVRRMVDRGEFIQPLILSERRVAFSESEVDEWISRRPRGSLPPVRP